jgi:ESF2/ABP1 family protein
MAKQTDQRFTLSDDFDINPPASSSKLMSEQVVSGSELSEVDDVSQDSDQEDNIHGLDGEMDADDFSGPKIVKPLTPEALAAFQAAQEKAGVIYISRIPPGMQPTKVRHLMSQYGEVGRVYLQKEGMTIRVLDHTRN